jgi:hypothetical protein
MLRILTRSLSHVNKLRRIWRRMYYLHSILCMIFLRSGDGCIPKGLAVH